MKIYHDRAGHIVGVCKDSSELGGRHIKLPDQKVPKDFMSTHLSGKYTISAGKLNKGKAQEISSAFHKRVNTAVEDRMSQLIGQDELKKIRKKIEP